MEEGTAGAVAPKNKVNNRRRKIMYAIFDVYFCVFYVFFLVLFICFSGAFFLILMCLMCSPRLDVKGRRVHKVPRCSSPSHFYVDAVEQSKFGPDFLHKMPDRIRLNRYDTRFHICFIYVYKYDFL